MPLQRGPRLENNVRAANVVPEGTIGLTHFRPEAPLAPETGR